MGANNLGEFTRSEFVEGLTALRYDRSELVIDGMGLKNQLEVK